MYISGGLLTPEQIQADKIYPCAALSQGSDRHKVANSLQQPPAPTGCRPSRRVLSVAGSGAHKPHTHTTAFVRGIWVHAWQEPSVIAKFV